MSLTNTYTHGKLQRCQTLWGDMQITAETKQTYDLEKFAAAQSYGSALKMVERPNRERQMYKCHDP